MSHLTDDQLSALADGALAGGARASAERHLEGCARCREALAGLVARDRALASTLEHDPGEAYFESFVGRVGGRIRAAGLKGAQAREPEGRGLADWFRAPRKLALVAAVATVVAGAGIVMLASREVRMPALRNQEIERRVAQEAPAPPPSGSSSAQPPLGALASPPAAQAPLPDAVRPRADSRAKTSVVSSDELAAAAKDRRAPTNRAYQVIRNEAGEDVPVRKPGEFVYRPQRPAPVPRPAVPGEPVYAQKPQYAEPLGSEKRTGAMRGGAQPVPSEAGTPVSSADRSASGVAAKTMSEEESRSVQAPRVEGAVAARKELAAPDLAQGLAGRGPALQVRGAPEAFDGLPARPRVLAKNAQQRTALAEATGLASSWDSAANEWERVIEGVQGGPLESETRFQVARARFVAWQRGANGSRATRATLALNAFLAHAPRGVEQDSARAWLAELKK